MPTKTKETAEKANQAQLTTRPERNEDGEWKAESYEASLMSLSVKDIEHLLDHNVIPKDICELILNWRDGREMVNVPKSFTKPTDEMGEIIAAAPVFTPQAWKRMLGQLDLAHRKVTPDKDGKVAEEEDTGNTVWDNEAGKLVPVMRWNKNCEKRWSAKDKSNLFNFVHRGVSMLNLEPQYADKVKEAIVQGYRTIQQRKTKSSFISKMVKPAEVKSKSVTIDGDEMTKAELESLYREWKRSQESADSDSE